MSNLSTARAQTQAIGAAINGSSSAVQTLGSMGHDPHPERLLAVGLAHTQNALAAVVAELEELRSEVEVLRQQGRRVF